MFVMFLLRSVACDAAMVALDVIKWNSLTYNYPMHALHVFPALVLLA